MGTDHWAAKKYFKMIDIFLTEKQFYLTLINHCAYKIVLNFVLFEQLTPVRSYKSKETL